ncbi:MAG: hypothetical protein HC845_15135, partial [Akkermansiaceae bacterium]|nr:hypothetical protein [Akkermansiaceae bacterium]
MPPNEAAQQWLVLFDTFVIIPRELLWQGDYENRLSLKTIIEALPPSAAWDALNEEILKRKANEENPFQEESLRLLISVLRGDVASRKASLAKIGTLAKNTKNANERQRYELNVETFINSLELAASSGADKMAAFSKILTTEENRLKKGSSTNEDLDSYSNDFDIPDLLQNAKEEAVTPLIVRSLKLNTKLNVEGNLTRRLTAKLALKHIDKLKQPLWNLVETKDEILLYEAMSKKFTTKEDSSWEKNKADTVYFLNLIAEDRSDDAAKFVRDLLKQDKQQDFSLEWGEIEEMQRQGFGTQVLAFLQRMLTEDPTLPFWKAYIEFSAHEGDSPKAVTFMRESLTKLDASAPARAEIESHLYEALLAADQVDEGIEMLKALIKSGPRAGKVDDKSLIDEMKKKWEQLNIAVSDDVFDRVGANVFGEKSNGEEEHIRLAEKLVKLGVLLERPELVQEGISTAIASYQKISLESYSRTNLLQEIVSLLVELKRGPEAEKLVIDEMVFLAQPKSDQSYGSNDDNEALTTLAWIYSQAGRSADIVKMLDSVSSWNASDLSQLVNNSFGNEPLLLIAAQALADQGKVDEARLVARHAIHSFPQKDAGYAL